MSSSLQLRATISPLCPSSKNIFAAVSRRLLCRRRSPLPFVSLTLQSHSDAGASSTSEPSHSHLTSSVGSSLHPSHWNLTHRHISLFSMPLLACQEITQGVRSSTRTVRVAEERLRGFATMGSSASLQAVTRTKAEPGVARTARGLREGLVNGRTMLQMFSLLPIFQSLLDYITRRRKS